MNKKQKDKGLMKAVKEQPQFRLTSNFTFRTMQKVEEAILLREKKQERKMLLATIAASLFLIISGSIGLYIYFGNCLLYTSDAADEEDSVDIGGSRNNKKKKHINKKKNKK